MYQGERLNSVTHLVGAGLAVAGACTLITLTALEGDAYRIVGASVFSATLILLYVASTLYHSVRGVAKRALMKFDHCAIYLLIAGTYTPFTLVTLRGALGWTLLGVIWGLAVLGIARETWWARRKESAWLLLYVVMGWLGVFAIGALAAQLSHAAMALLLAGGVLYTAGILFFVNDNRWRHAHGIWHLFVLAGSTSHFFSVAVTLVPIGKAV